jgi:hypothetical protein
VALCRTIWTGEVVERTADGVPYLAPEVVLLFKARNARNKDEADLYTVLPELDDARLRWLDGALALVDPDHPWRGTVRNELITSA